MFLLLMLTELRWADQCGQRWCEEEFRVPCDLHQWWRHAGDILFDDK